MGKSATVGNLDIVTEYSCGGESNHLFSLSIFLIHSLILAHSYLVSGYYMSCFYVNCFVLVQPTLLKVGVH